MRGWRLGLVAVAVAVMVAGGVTRTDAANVFEFGDSGKSSGAAQPVPLQWEVISGAIDFWRINFTEWPSATSVTDFHISFTERTIAASAVTQFTSFEPGPVGAGWTRVISADGSSVDFFAPEGVSLDQGESFFVNVAWNENADAVRTFSAHWTTSVPEPATLMLLGTGLVALAAVRRRRA